MRSSGSCDAKKRCCVHEMKRDRWAAGNAVLSNPDLVCCILSGGIGPSTYFAATLVCKSWRDACRSDETLLRLVALYQGGLTRGMFTRLFALTTREARDIPHTTHKRFQGGTYYLYSKDAVDCILAPGGFVKWRERLDSRPVTTRVVRSSHELEDGLHRRAVRMIK